MTARPVYVVERVMPLLREAADRARPNETGGVLVGVLRDGEPWVTSAVEIIDLTRTSTRFVIPYGATPVAVDAAAEREGRVGLIGFWHSHPADAPASPTDKATLSSEARRRTQQKGVPAVLFIVRGTAAGWCVDVLLDKGDGPTTTEILLTGPLSREDKADGG